jgi:DNA (cytosine-5)-methyltransferase 1
MMERCNFIGMEREAIYVEIATARINYWKRASFLEKKGLRSRRPVAQAISDLERKHGDTDCPDAKKFRSGVYARAKNQYQRLMRNDSLLTIPDSHRFPKHRSDIVKRFKVILKYAPRNKQLSGDLRVAYDLKKRSITPLDGDLICPTITSLPDDYIHYSEPRVLTVRECARIRSFPDDFEFRGKYTSGGDRRSKEVPRYTQIGNAIPPLFAELAGEVLKEMIGPMQHEGRPVLASCFGRPDRESLCRLLLS